MAHAGNIFATLAFVALYGARLMYQALLLRHRDKSGTHGDNTELLLVLIPKNLLVAITVWFLLRGVPHSGAFILGWLLFIAGLGIRFIALKQLGDMYSLNVDIRQQHHLVTGGIYSLVRHPLYLAYILDTLGMIVFLQNRWLGLFLVPITLGWVLRIPHEEALLQSLFGDEYVAYAKRVPRLNILRGAVRYLRDRFVVRSAQSPLQIHSIVPVTSPGARTDPLSDAEKAEIDIHLTEYKALSDFQRDAKSTCVRIATYHNTGITLVGAWAIQNSSNPQGVVAGLVRAGYFFPILFALPILNAVLIVASAYHSYSFFCVAFHFANLRRRLRDLVGADVFAYEDKFKVFIGKERQLSIFLDLVAGVMWFVVPVILAVAVSLVAVVRPDSLTSILSALSYTVGTAASLVAVFYLGTLFMLIRRMGDQS